METPDAKIVNYSRSSAPEREPIEHKRGRFSSFLTLRGIILFLIPLAVEIMFGGRTIVFSVPLYIFLFIILHLYFGFAGYEANTPFYKKRWAVALICIALFIIIGLTGYGAASQALSQILRPGLFSLFILWIITDIALTAGTTMRKVFFIISTIIATIALGATLLMLFGCLQPGGCEMVGFFIYATLPIFLISGFFAYSLYRKDN